MKSPPALMNISSDDLESLLTLAIENEKIQNDLTVAMLSRDKKAAVRFIHQLQSGLSKASNLARKVKGLPSIREENKQDHQL